jgi:hypothetical protein
VKDCTAARNAKTCTCTYSPCPRKGVCCECIAYHWGSREVPGCMFPPEVERTYDRSLSKFLETWKKRER